VLSFLERRATPGVEHLARGRYRRTVRLGRHLGLVSVGLAPGKRALDVRVTGLPSSGASTIATRMRQLFDTDADPAAIARTLGADPLLASDVIRHPGIRVPGAWDGFELAVRAVLGQQVSVRAATTIAGRLAAQFGTPVTGGAALNRLFPTPQQLMTAELERVGVLSSRARTIRLLAERLAAGTLTIEPTDPAAVMTALRTIPGIGPWTAGYIAMRACGDRDAFLTGDLILRRAAGGLSTRALEERAERWRPYRAYAVMLLWQP
jgi:AraC family transcriptional regulator of adaptative response / DNA-3-methyladenine glycosylase II